MAPIEVDEEEVAVEASKIHYARLREFAESQAPAMLGSLNAAWEKYGTNPM